MIPNRIVKTVDDYLDSYIFWLMELTSAPITYRRLFGVLQTTEFYWFAGDSGIGMDRNRASDGIKLREEYMREFIPDDLTVKFVGGDVLTMAEYFNSCLGECTVLEMIVALARRMEHHVSERQIDSIFWDILSNLGIEDCDDEAMEYRENDVRDRIAVMLNRKYGKTGKGSMFPVNDRNFDLRDMEIWRQANLYCQRKEANFE